MHVGDENSPANLRNTPKSMAISNFRSGSWLRENVVARRADKGGWNLLFSWWLAGDVINPAVHFGLSGAGPRAWFGWPDVPQLEPKKLVLIPGGHFGPYRSEFKVQRSAGRTCRAGND